MFEFITDKQERGQVGIGTLIVFIAMVLVAAIAAGVLINTAGFLQSQAEATGEESTDLVSERIDVTSTVGIVSSDADDGELSEVRVTVSGAPGADDIDLTETTIQAVGPGGQSNLVFVDETEDENGEPSEDITDLDGDEFAIGSDGDFEDDAVLDGEEQFTILLNPEAGALENEDNPNDAFGENDRATLDIVSPAGATTSVELRAPSLFSDDNEAVRL